jgi:hypothetical protein
MEISNYHRAHGGSRGGVRLFFFTAMDTKVSQRVAKGEFIFSQIAQKNSDCFFPYQSLVFFSALLRELNFLLSKGKLNLKGSKISRT